MGDADLAIVTTKGFTSGARDAAVDEDVAMVLLRPYDEATEQANFVRAINVTMNFLGPPIVTNFSVELNASQGSVQRGTFQTNTLQALERDDGTAAETLAERMAHAPATEVGEFDRRLELPDARRLRLPGGRVQIHATTWHEKIVQSSHSFSIEAKGEPKLVIQQLDEDLKTSSGRLVVDRISTRGAWMTTTTSCRADSSRVRSQTPPALRARALSSESAQRGDTWLSACSR